MEWTTRVNQWVKWACRLMGVSEAAASSEISLDDLRRDNYTTEGSHLWYETAQLKSSHTLRADTLLKSTHQDRNPEHFIQGKHRRRTKDLKDEELQQPLPFHGHLTHSPVSVHWEFTSHSWILKKIWNLW